MNTSNSVDPERWKRIDETFHAAFDRESSARALAGVPQKMNLPL
jgi:hypothetical protein